MAEETLTADNAAWVRLQGWSVTQSDWLFDPEKVAVYLLAQDSCSQKFAQKKY